MQKADQWRDLDTIASDPDQGKSDRLRKPIPGHGQADLLDGKNPVPGLKDKPDSKNFKTPARNKTSSDPDSGKTEYIAILIQNNKTKVNIGYIMKKMRKQRTQSPESLRVKVRIKTTTGKIPIIKFMTSKNRQKQHF